MPTINPAIKHRVNTNLARVAPANLRVFDAQVSTIPDIIKLTIGEPDFNVPDRLKEAAIQAIQDNDSHYTPGVGSLALRQAIHNFLNDRYQLDYDPQKEIAATIGVSQGLYAALAALINPGDQVLIPTPAFPLYEVLIKMLGGEPVLIDTSKDAFRLTPPALQLALAQAGDRAKALILNYPSNPTGVTYDPAQLTALAQVIEQTPLVVLADEIYSELTYDGTHTSIARELPGQTLVFNGVSKSHAMTGYRIGFVAGPAELMQTVGMVSSLMITSPSTPAMAAAVAALNTPAGKEATAQMKAEYQARRDYLLGALTKLGFPVANPGGAFYLFAQLPARFGTADKEFATNLAHEAQVALAPGSFFGPGGAGYLRISYASSMATLQEAVARVGRFLSAH